VGSVFACTPLSTWTSPLFIALALADSACTAVFYVAYIYAPQHISGSEVQLVMLLEVILGPFWVFLRFGELPTVWTVGGGFMLLVALGLQEYEGMLDARREADAEKGLDA